MRLEGGPVTESNSSYFASETGRVVCAIVGDFNGTCLLDGTRRGSRGCLCGAVAGVSCAEGALVLAVWPPGRPVPESGG